MSKQLCIKIARCNRLGVTPCNVICSVQSDCILKQTPEPWSGYLQQAQIMFISSNPSIDFDEHFPNIGWSDDDIFEFFEERFTNGKLVKSTGKKASVRYWNSLIKYTNWINKALNNKYFSKPIVQGNDGDVSALNPYVVSTEIVHCKSKNQIGVTQKCIEVCFKKYMPEIIDEFRGDLIVIVGGVAKKYISSIKTLIVKKNPKVTLIKVPHPSDPRYPSDAKKEAEIKKALKHPL